MTQSARDAILNRVRLALATPSPRPHWLDEPAGGDQTFQLPESNEAALRDRFRDEFTAIQGEYLEADSIASARTVMEQWIRDENVEGILASDRPQLREILGGIENANWVGSADVDTTGWEKADVGITTAESLVAESGTIVVSSGSSGRAISVLPPIHLVVASAHDLVADLETSIDRLCERYQNRLPSNCVWISGPSRTADIEKILVLGAHGPRRLVLLLIP